MPNGAEQMRVLAAELRAAGGPTGRSLRGRVRKGITAAVKPMQRAVQDNARAIPAKRSGNPPLGPAIASATSIRVGISGRTQLVRLWVNPAKMPNTTSGASMARLPVLMEGRRPWRHPVFGNRDNWVSESAHPYFDRAVEPRLPAVAVAVEAAVAETLEAIAHA